ncbi:MAG: glycoside hydrolase family 32 protein [Gilvibacter sp.]
MRYKVLLLIAVVCLSVGCKTESNRQETNSPKSEIATKSNYDEPYRSQYHFTPPEKWMNDPNGLVYHQGIYHLFYQYYPEDIVWGPMHWGHATSTDMVHWEHKPIALYPDELGLIFSGSAVIDKENTTGFGTKENPPLVAIFTYHLMKGEQEGRKDFQTQGIAYSLDNGDTWTKYEGNPVIGNEGIKDFRDPKVFWDKNHKKWVMALVAGDHAKFYSSSNLKEWSLMSEFGKDKGAHGGVWECPDLFSLPNPTTGEPEWVLLISMNPGAPNGGSGTQYFIGDWDGTAFTTEQTEPLWLDYGTDNYAGVTYNNEPNNERLFIGWMSNWNYARDTPTKVWRSAMTLPRTLSLKQTKEGLRLANSPYHKVNTLVNNQEPIYSVDMGSFIQKDGIQYKQHLIEFTATSSNTVTLMLGNEQREFVSFDINPAEGNMIFDRTNSGVIDFEESFGAPHFMPYTPEGKEVHVRVFIDASSIEVFVNDGLYVFTEQVFPTVPYHLLTLTGKEDDGLSDFKIKAVQSIWNK